MPNKENLEKLLKSLASTFQSVRIYTLNHPKAKTAMQDLYDMFKELFQDNPIIAFGLVGDELFCGKEIFFDLTVIVKDFIKELKNKKIENISFKSSLSYEELETFIDLLAFSKQNSVEEINKSIKSKNIHNVTVDVLHAPGIKPESGETEHKYNLSKDDVKHFKNFYSGIIDNAGSLLDKSIIDGVGDMNIFSNIVTSIFEGLGHKENFLLMLMNLKKHDDYTLVHCINVSILCMLQARSLGLNEQDIVDLGLAGFLHDIGKILISRTILRKPNSLSKEEFEAVKSHTVLGAKMLMRFPHVNKMVVLTAFEHHLGIGSQGYPKLSYPQRQCFSTKIVAISDFYDALRSRRHYRRLMAPEIVYEIMRSEKDKLLDSQLLDNFFKIMGVWPVGTVVSLSSGEIAFVEAQNLGDMFNPKVRVFFSSNKEKLEATYSIDLSQIEDLQIISSIPSDSPECEYIFAHLDK